MNNRTIADDITVARQGLANYKQRASTIMLETDITVRKTLLLISETRELIRQLERPSPPLLAMQAYNVLESKPN